MYVDDPSAMAVGHVPIHSWWDRVTSRIKDGGLRLAPAGAVRWNPASPEALMMVQPQTRRLHDSKGISAKSPDGVWAGPTEAEKSAKSLVGRAERSELKLQGSPLLGRTSRRREGIWDWPRQRLRVPERVARRPQHVLVISETKPCPRADGAAAAARRRGHPEIWRRDLGGPCGANDRAEKGSIRSQRLRVTTEVLTWAFISGKRSFSGS